MNALLNSPPLEGPGEALETSYDYRFILSKSFYATGF